MSRFRLAQYSLVCLALLAVGCGKKTVPATPAADPVPAVAAAPPPPPSPPPMAEPAAEPTRPETEDEAFARKTLDQLNAERPLADVRFDVDHFQVDERGRAVLDDNARWLQRWQSTRIVIEGHGDARGTSEYNLALGERRARAIKDYLVDLGVAGWRIEVLTKGKEHPVCDQQSEECWERNRRGHFVLTAK